MDSFSIGQINILGNGDFEHRYKLMKEAVEYHKLDFVIAQEVVDTELYTRNMNEAGYEHVEFSRVYGDDRTKCYLAIASKTPLVDVGEVPLDETGSRFEKEGVMMVRQTVFKDKTINLFNAHLAWGFHNEVARISQVESLDSKALELERDHPGSVSILSGDLNALPEARSIRFLRGFEPDLKNEYSTLWVDAWEKCGTHENQSTSKHFVNPLGMETAVRAGIIYPEHMPPRRIDYLMVRGWAYGKLGCPLTFSYIEHPSGEFYSDHEPIAATFLIP